MSIAEQVLQLKTDFDEVKQAGYAEGYDVGYSYGGAHGYSEGFFEGKTIGYNDGYVKGDADGYDRGHEQGVTDGKQAEYDAFWDNYQQNGNRTNYTSAFGGCWNVDLFKPKYSIRPTSAYFMFFNNAGEVINIGEVAEDYFDSLGIELDYSKAKQCMYAIAALHAKRFKKLDFSSAINTNSLFYTHNNVINNNNSVEEIDEFVSSEITTYDNSTFQHVSHLRDIRFTGVIAKGVVNFQWSPNLSKASIESIINALSPTTQKLNCTFSKTAVNNAFGSTTADEWTALIATKPNWTITLV